jgi:hypothetical protein
VGAEPLLGERRVAGEFQNSSRERPQNLALDARVSSSICWKSLGSGVCAVTVAVRGVGSSSEISPTKSPAPSVATPLPFLATSTLPSTSAPYLPHALLGSDLEVTRPATSAGTQGSDCALGCRAARMHHIQECRAA